MIQVITVTSHIEPTIPLVETLLKHNWRHSIIETPWRGFGTKIIKTYEYLIANPEITEFIFCDAFDVYAFGTPEEFMEKLDTSGILMSAERGLWPQTLESFRKLYVSCVGDFNYINSGLYYAPRDLFIELFESNPPKYETDDQEWFNMHYLHTPNSRISIDNFQKVFNSHSFIREGEYGYDNGRLQILGNEPVFTHKNARTVDDKLEEIVKS